MPAARTLASLLVALLLTLPIRAEDSPPLDAYPGIAEALAKAAAYLHAKAESDEDDHWVLPPIRHRRNIGSREVQVRYTRRMVEVPVYQYYTEKEYRNVRVSDVSGAPLVRQLVDVQKRRQTGTEMQERLIHDPEGSVIRTERRPEYAPGGAVEWRQYQLGTNAKAAYAMILAGIDPSDKVIDAVTLQYNELMRSHGLPDDTWDVAWMTCLFSVLPGDANAQTTRNLAAKLMDGQHDEGELAGLWGPVCVNRQILAHWIKERDSLAQEYVRAQQRGNENEKFRLENRLQNIAGTISRVSLHAHTGHRIQDRARLTDDTGSITILQGTTEYLFNQATADLESTAIAVYALSVAGRHQRLPESTTPPVGGSFNRPITPPRTPQSVLAAAAQAVARVQDRSGGWTDTNLHAPSRAFDEIKTLPGIPAARRAFTPLPSGMTFTSIARGYSCFASIAALAGVPALQAYRANMHYGGLALKHFTERMGEVDFETVAGGDMPPYEALFFGARILPPETPEAAVGLAEAGTLFLLQAQRDDGSWRQGRSGINMRPTSLKARMENLPDYFRQDLDAYDLTKPHVPIADPKEGDPLERNRSSAINQRFHSPREVLTTTYAMLFLTERLAEEDAAQSSAD